MNKTFRPYDPHQQFLVPPSLDDWLPENDLARFVSDLVDEVIDLQPFLDSYKEVRGFPPYDPRLMLKLLLYGYSTGTRSSRAIEKACWHDVAFRWLAANEAPDFRSIARFRRRHLVALRELFRTSLLVCQEAGMVRLGMVALDGTKVRANASRRKAMSYRHLTEKERSSRQRSTCSCTTPRSPTRARTRRSARTTVTRTFPPSSPGASAGSR